VRLVDPRHRRGRDHAARPAALALPLLQGLDPRAQLRQACPRLGGSMLGVGEPVVVAGEHLCSRVLVRPATHGAAGAWCG